MEAPAVPTVAPAADRIETQLKIRRSAAEGGTESLCDRCMSSVIYRRANALPKQVYCTRVCEYVPSDIQDCNAFTDMKEMPLYAMKEIALEINKEAIREIGFKTEIKSEQ